MKRFLVCLFLSTLGVSVWGCGGDSKKDNKQPQLSGPPDPKVQGPVSPSGGPAPSGGKGGNAKPGID